MRLAALAVPAPAHAPPEGTAPASTRPAPGLSVLQAVVRRLDVLGLMRRLFSALSDGVKQDRRYWNDLATVLGARDPAFNREDLRRLLHVSTFLWIITIDEVTFEEALFAFHILRALPEDQRRAFELEDRGAYAARIAGALSQSMLHEAGLSFAFTRPDERGKPRCAASWPTRRHGTGRTLPIWRCWSRWASRRATLTGSSSSRTANGPGPARRLGRWSNVSRSTTRAWGARSRAHTRSAPHGAAATCWRCCSAPAPTNWRSTPALSTAPTPSPGNPRRMPRPPGSG
ncbi:hypothetical protein ACFSLT_28320 [Novosphingobium resinovorum]